MFNYNALKISWCGAGSNRRHKDFQSFALPTELPHLFLFLFRRGGYRTFFAEMDIHLSQTFFATADTIKSKLLQRIIPTGLQIYKEFD